MKHWPSFRRILRQRSVFTSVFILQGIANQEGLAWEVPSATHDLFLNVLLLSGPSESLTMNALLWQLIAGRDHILDPNQYPHFYENLDPELRNSFFLLKPRGFDERIESTVYYVLLDCAKRMYIRGEDIDLNFGNMWVDNTHKLVFKGLFQFHLDYFNHANVHLGADGTLNTRKSLVIPNDSFNKRVDIRVGDIKLTRTLDHLFNEMPKIDPGPHPKLALSELFSSYRRLVRLRIVSQLVANHQTRHSFTVTLKIMVLCLHSQVERAQAPLRNHYLPSCHKAHLREPRLRSGQRRPSLSQNIHKAHPQL